jgi:hypothetical protein
VKFLINLSCRVPDTRPLVGVGAGRAGGEAPGPRRESPVQMPSPPPVDQPRGGTPPPEEYPVRVAEPPAAEAMKLGAVQVRPAAGAEPAAVEERPAEQAAAPEDQAALHVGEGTPGERRESPAPEAAMAPQASPRRPELPLDDIQMADYNGGEWAPWVTPQGSPRGLQDEREEDDDDTTQLVRRLAESAERAQVSEIHHCYLVLHVPVALYLEHAC